MALPGKAVIVALSVLGVAAVVSGCFSKSKPTTTTTTTTTTTPTTPEEFPEAPEAEVPAKFYEGLQPSTKTAAFKECSLHLREDKYSVVPSNSTFLFSRAGSCQVKKPAHWDEWVTQHFGRLDHPDATYFSDPDNDGLVNLLEYYANDLVEEAGGNANGITQSSARGLDPTNPDSDGDLLSDGFEMSPFLVRLQNPGDAGGNGRRVKRWSSTCAPDMGALPTDPFKQNDKTEDFDGDGLDYLNEQIQGTKPNNEDTDCDSVSDGDEVARGSDPLDKDDCGKFAPSANSAEIEFEFGDPSGSHSERYELWVDGTKYSNPEWGVVDTIKRKYIPGQYKVTLRHWDNKNKSPQPDYDYTALIRKVGGDAEVVIRNEHGDEITTRHLNNGMGEIQAGALLGTTGDNGDDDTSFERKFATLIVTDDCSNSGSVECSCQRKGDCSTCMADRSCVWKKNTCRASDYCLQDEDRQRIKLVCLMEAGDCGFYHEVEMQTQKSCGQDEYAEGFGFKFCNAQKNQMGNFSPQGKDHVTAFWKCQMLAMIRKLEESQAPNCKELTVASLDSHTACYERTSSFCKVTLSDVTTLKDIFTAGGTDGFSKAGLSQMEELDRRFQNSVTCDYGGNV